MNRLHTTSGKEIKRSGIRVQLAKKRLTQRMAAEQLGLTIRQVKRLWRAYKGQGADGLIHKSRGKPSHNQMDKGVKQVALDLILERYRDFGPTLATEKLVAGIRILHPLWVPTAANG